MKLSTLFMIMIALQFTLLMFGENSSTGLSYGASANLSQTTNSTALFEFVQKPFDWSSLGLLTWIGLLAGGISFVAFVGTLVFGKNDLAVFSGAVAVFIGFCFPIASLWNVIAKEVGYFGVEAAPVIASVICAPLVILSIVTILNWWRSASDIN